MQVVTSFDEAQGQNPEGIAIDRTGSIFVSVSPLGDVWRIPPGSDDPQPFGHVDGITPGADFGLLGLAVDVFGNVYGAVQSANPDGQRRLALRPVHRRCDTTAGHRGDGHPERSRVRQADEPLRDRFGPRRDLADPLGRQAAIWLQDPALTGDGSLGLGLGANGIAVQRGVFTVTNTERRTILRIPKVGGEPARSPS